MAARITRAERVRQIQELRAQGLTYREVAARLGLSLSNVNNIMVDPDGSKQRARRVRYQGVCVDCGGPTDGASGRDKAPLRCHYCAQGKRPETPTRRSWRRRLPVRLCDLPLDVRLEGAREANRWENGEPERRDIFLAAVLPSENTYWLAESARPKLEAMLAMAEAEAA